MKQTLCFVVSIALLILVNVTLINIKESDVRLIQQLCFNTYGATIKPKGTFAKLSFKPPVLLFWLNTSSESNYTQNTPFELSYRFQEVDICWLSKKWIDAGFAEFHVIARDPINCEGVKTILRSSLEIPPEVSNPFKLEWFLHKIKFDFLYIQDDMFTGCEVDVAQDFLFTHNEMREYTDGDNAYINTAKVLFKLGDDFINTPKEWIMHGPQYIRQDLSAKAYNLMKRYAIKTSNTRGFIDFSFLETYGVLSLISGLASYAPPHYFYYLNTNHILLNKTIPPAMFYCLNDGEYQLEWVDRIKVIQTLSNCSGYYQAITVRT
jgi:hypothetical protein